MFILEFGELRYRNFEDARRLLKRLEEDTRGLELRTVERMRYDCPGDIHADMMTVLEMVIYKHDAGSISSFFSVLDKIENDEGKKRVGEHIFCAGPLRENYALEGYVIQHTAQAAKKVNEWLEVYNQRIAAVLAQEGNDLLERARRLQESSMERCNKDKCRHG